MLTHAKSKLPKIGSSSYKELSFKEQLKIYSLYLSDKNRYVELTGGIPTDDELSYVNEAIQFISSQSNIKVPPAKDMPIGFIQNHWACYNSYYNPSWYEEGMSPLDLLGINHKRILGMQLFTFPILICDFVTQAIMHWFCVKKTRYLSDMLYYVVRMRAAAEYYFEYEDLRMLAVEDDVKKTHPIMVEIWNKSLDIKIPTIEAINGAFPVIEECELMTLVEDSTYTMYHPHMKYVDKKRSFVPLVPTDLLQKSQFKIRGWDFLDSLDEVSVR